MMKDYDKEIENIFLDEEEDVLERIRIVYQNSLKDVQAYAKRLQKEIAELEKNVAEDDVIGLTKIRSKVYQLEYQRNLAKQISNYLDVIKDKDVTNITDYINRVYSNGFLTEQYRLMNNGINITMPINQKLLKKAVTFNVDDIPLSKRLYANVDKAKKEIINEISRGLSTGMSVQDMARNLQNTMGVSQRKAYQIAQNEGARVRQSAIIDSMREAKKKGADIVKQWSATLDGKTRPVHQELDSKWAEIEEDFEYSGGKVFAPKQFGIPSLDINCRCTLLSMPRWDIEDEHWQMDNERKVLVKVKNYSDWIETYQKEIEKYRKEHPNRTYVSSRDIEQYERYLKLLGTQYVPNSLSDFMELKNDKEKWNDLKAKYRTANRYKVDYGNFTTEEILELDKYAYNMKRKFTTNKYVKNGNIGVAKIGEDYYCAFSRIDNINSKAFKKYTGDKDNLILLSSNQHYITSKVGDIVDGIATKYDRNVDTEAKIFEYVRTLYKPNDTFVLTILSERNMCESCRGVYKQFAKEFPNAIINVVSGKKIEGGGSLWKYRKISKED